MTRAQQIIRLDPETTAAVEQLQRDGETKNDVIRRLLGWQPVGDRRRKAYRDAQEITT